MASVREHYDEVLSPHYSRMFGDFEAKVAEQQALLQWVPRVDGELEEGQAQGAEQGRHHDQCAHVGHGQRHLQWQGRCPASRRRRRGRRAGHRGDRSFATWGG